MNALFSLHRQVFSLVETVLLPIATLITRLYLGKVFLTAGSFLAGILGRPSDHHR